MNNEDFVRRGEAILSLGKTDLHAAWAEFERLVAEYKSEAIALEDADEWFNLLWDKFPKTQHDGTPAPHRSKSICKERFAKCCKKYKITPEKLVHAIAAYTSKCNSEKTWFCGLDTLLMNKAGYWLDYLEVPRG